MARKKEERGGGKKGGTPSPTPSAHDNHSSSSSSGGPGSSGKEQKGKKGGKNDNKDESYMVSNDEHFTRFRNQLTPLGLMLRDITGDGNCLFRALGDQMEGHGNNHFKHRMDTVRYMIQAREDFEPFIEDDSPFENYIDNLARPGTYAGQDSLVAFARMHKVNIYIHQLNSPMWKIEGGGNPGCRDLHLSYHNGEHYSSVRLIGDWTDVPANVSISSKLQKAVSNNNYNKPNGSISSPSSVPNNNLKALNKIPFGHNSSGAMAFMDSATEDDFDLESGSETPLGAPSSSFLPSTPLSPTALPLDQMTQLVMETSNCYDSRLVEQSLEEHQFNIEMTVDYLVNLMFLTQNKAEPADSAQESDSVSAKLQRIADDDINLGKEDELCREKNMERERDFSKSGAKPKTILPRPKHLTNRERKDEKRREKLARKQEERIKKGSGTAANDVDNNSVFLTANFSCLNL